MGASTCEVARIQATAAFDQHLRLPALRTPISARTQTHVCVKGREIHEYIDVYIYMCNLYAFT